MMRAVVLLHRWLGVVFCLFFAMWFASGIVMHFVPFPALSDAARFGGLAPLDLTALAHGPADAVAAGGIEDATRVRLLQRPDGPVYLVSGASGVVALHAADLSDAAVSGAPLALAIATDYARHWHLSFAAATSELTSYDQWTVSSAFDRSPSDVSDRARRRSRHRDLCLVQNRRNRAGDDALPAGVELCRQRRALDLSDRAAPSSGGVERSGLGAFVRGPDRCGCRRRDRRVAA